MVSQTRTYRVLIVDDDDDARVLLTRALRKVALVLDVAVAADGVHALEMAAERRPDLIITDIMMPRMNGFDLCTALRARPDTAGVPIIMVTALQDERDRQRGLALGANEYLTKPFNSTELGALLKALLGASQPSAARRS